jgi:hypothetical protein
VVVRHLLLDLAGVLCRFDSTARLERFAAASRLETAEVDERLYGSGIVDRCDRGELDAAGIRDVLREQLGLDCGDVELAPRQPPRRCRQRPPQLRRSQLRSRRP